MQKCQCGQQGSKASGDPLCSRGKLHGLGCKLLLIYMAVPFILSTGDGIVVMKNNTGMLPTKKPLHQPTCHML